MIKEFFDGIERVNAKRHGGCLVIALAFYRFLLSENMPSESFELYQYDGFCPTFHQNEQWIHSSGTVGYPESARHFIWKYNDIFYDGEGEFDLEEWRCEHGGSPELLINWDNLEMFEPFCLEALKYGGWNDCFVRDVEVPKIEDALGIDLSEVW